MTYQTMTAPTVAATFVRNVLGHVGGFFKSVGRVMMMSSSMQHRVDYVHSLQAKSDEELAAMKIKREDIIHEVFKDLYYV